MVAYEYRCNTDGVFSVDVPMGNAQSAVECQVCRGSAKRVYSAPMVAQGPAHLVAAIDRAEKSSDEPDIVTSLPRRAPHKRTPMAPHNPAFSRLPRP